MEIRPQPRQELFLSSSADIMIYGGAAGGGKTWSLLVEPLRHLENEEFGAVTLRRTQPEITKEGALWDEALKLYSHFDAVPNQNKLKFVFPSGMTCTFASLQYETSLDAWRGAQIPLLNFDQLETFTEKQFFYMLSRNRSTCGVIPYVRATCNPEPGWLAKFLDWWIAKDGYADLSRVGKIRWMTRVGDEIVWGNSREEVIQKTGDSEALPLSVTFIVSTVFDNQVLLQQDPKYLANLKALDFIDQSRLLGDPKRGGNWKIKPSAGKVVNRDWIDIIPMSEVPKGGVAVRFWDFAATLKSVKKKGNQDPDFSASVLMKKVGSIYYILDCTNERLNPAQTDERVEAQASKDGPNVAQRWEIESGASGKRDSHHLATMLDGLDAMGRQNPGDKLTRGKTFAAACFAGNVKVVKAKWTETLLDQLHAFPDGAHDDIWDCATGCYRELTGQLTKKPKGWS